MQAVSVDRHFVRIGTKSYAVDRITSVEVRAHRPHRLAPAGAAAGIALLLLVVAATDGHGRGSAPYLGLAVTLIFLALWCWQRWRLRVWQLFLSPAFPPEPALVSRDRAAVLVLRDRIEAAIAARAAPDGAAAAGGPARHLMGTGGARSPVLPGEA